MVGDSKAHLFDGALQLGLAGALLHRRLRRLPPGGVRVVVEIAADHPVVRRLRLRLDQARRAVRLPEAIVYCKSQF